VHAGFIAKSVNGLMLSPGGPSFRYAREQPRRAEGEVAQTAPEESVVQRNDPYERVRYDRSSQSRSVTRLRQGLEIAVTGPNVWNLTLVDLPVS
jgi:hypothetical protein